MNITVKYFASLREQLGKSEETLTLDVTTPISEVWQSVSGISDSENILMTINMEYVKVTGGDTRGSVLPFSLRP